jgi:two-component sensor histidine kinase
MRPVTLRNGLVVIVATALVPIGTLSVVQALANLRYSQTLIGNQLVTSALATAGHEHDPFIIAEQTAITVSKVKAVREIGSDCRQALQAGLSGNPTLVNLVRSDATGRPRCSVLPFDPSTNFAKERWWQEGLASKKFTMSTPVVGPISRIPVLIGMQPILTSDGHFDGSIQVGIDLSKLRHSLGSKKLESGAHVVVTDGSGSLILTEDNTPFPHFDVRISSGKTAKAVARDGTVWMYASAPLYKDNLYVVYAERQKDLMATALKQVRIDLILPIIALLIASLAIWLGTNRLVLRWLDSLRTLAAQFAGGDFTGDPDKYERAPREIGLLSADLHWMAQTIEARDHALQAALDAKTALTHDIHHRVKNNLQIVSSLLSLQAAKIGDPAARDALSQTRARIGALAQIHRLLYEESQDSDHGEVNIAKLLTALCSQLRALHRGQSAIQLTCDVASLTVPINSAVPLTLLAVEAVTNAYRHGFQSDQSGLIFVQFGVTDDRATLSISDDGMGFDPETTAASMGRELMDAFAQQLGGELNIASTPGTGTVVTLRYLLHPVDGQPA